LNNFETTLLIQLEQGVMPVTVESRHLESF